MPRSKCTIDQASRHEHHGEGSYQAIRQLHRARPSERRGAERIAGGPARPVRFRQDNAAAYHRRAGDPGRRRGAVPDEEVTCRPAHDRNVGFVFQHYALFRHMTIFENVAFGLRVRHRPESARSASSVQELLKLVHLEGWRQQLPVPAFGRPAAARRPGAGTGGAAEGAAARRAVRRPGCQGAAGAAALAAQAARRDPRDQRLRDPRSGRGVRGRRQRRGDERAAASSRRARRRKFSSIRPIPSSWTSWATSTSFTAACRTGERTWAGWKWIIPITHTSKSSPATVYVRPHELEIGQVRRTEDSSIQARILHINPAGSVPPACSSRPRTSTCCSTWISASPAMPNWVCK